MFNGPISQLKPTRIAYFCWWNSSYLTVLEVASPSAELLWSVACQWLVIFGMELVVIYPMKMFGWSSKNCPNSQCGRAIIDTFDTLVATILMCRMYGLWKISACRKKNRNRSRMSINWPLVIQEVENDPFTSMIVPAMVSPCELV